MADLFPRTVETERLRLRAVSDDTVDARALYDLHGSVEGERLLSHRSSDPHRTLRESHEWIDEVVAAFESGETARYAVVPKGSEDGAGEFAGIAELLPQWDRGVAYLAIWLRERFWGRSYSGERAAALLQVAFDRLDLDQASIARHPDNGNSKRAIERYVERFGGRHDGRFRRMVAPDSGEPYDLVVYTIDRADWRASDRPEVTVRE